jgi:hypothetical protein
VSYGLRANYSFVVKKAWTEALCDATAARKAHHRVTELDPRFTDAKLTQGINDYVIGSLPFRRRMLGFPGGFYGDKERGMLIDLTENFPHNPLLRVELAKAIAARSTVAAPR